VEGKKDFYLIHCYHTQVITLAMLIFSGEHLVGGVLGTSRNLIVLQLFYY
jgi:hypothetical protein